MLFKSYSIITHHRNAALRKPWLMVLAFWGVWNTFKWFVAFSILVHSRWVLRKTCADHLITFQSWFPWVSRYSLGEKNKINDSIWLMSRLGVFPFNMNYILRLWNNLIINHLSLLIIEESSTATGRHFWLTNQIPLTLYWIHTKTWQRHNYNTTSFTFSPGGPGKPIMPSGPMSPCTHEHIKHTYVKPSASSQFKFF